MRNFLAMSLVGLALLAALAGAAAWYSLALPGRSHAAPLAPLTDEEHTLSALLTKHVSAVASLPHNVAHYAALEQSARYIERTLESHGYVVERQIFTTQGREVRNIEVKRSSRSASAPALVIGAHYDSFLAIHRVRTTMGRASPPRYWNLLGS